MRAGERPHRRAGRGLHVRAQQPAERRAGRGDAALPESVPAVSGDPGTEVQVSGHPVCHTSCVNCPASNACARCLSFAIDWRPGQRLLLYLKSAALVCHLQVEEGYPSAGQARLVCVQRDGRAVDTSGLQVGLSARAMCPEHPASLWSPLCRISVSPGYVYCCFTPCVCACVPAPPLCPHPH